MIKWFQLGIYVDILGTVHGHIIKAKRLSVAAVREGGAVVQCSKAYESRACHHQPQPADEEDYMGAFERYQ